MKRMRIYAETTDIPIVVGFDNFINKKMALNRSEETIKYYNIRFGKFIKYLEKIKNKTLANEIREEDINEYILYKRKINPNISNITINTELRAIRAVLYFLMDRGHIKFFNISLITVKKTAKDGYSKDEQSLLIKKPNVKNCSFPEYRNWVIICHLLASGNRSRTVRGIKNKHVDLKSRVILLTEVKNNQIYEMPITNEYYPILSEYMSIRKGEPDDYLFCNQYGNQLTADGLRVIMRRYNIAHNVNTTGLHRFRNTFAKNWILEGGSAKKLQAALGHSNPAMVDEYLNLYGRELKEDYGKYTPLANLKEKLETKKISIKGE